MTPFTTKFKIEEEIKEEVNKLIKKGWEVIEFYSTRPEEHLQMAYVLRRSISRIEESEE